MPNLPFPFPSYPLENEELLPATRSAMSFLRHTTSLENARAILKGRMMRGADPVHQACFGFKLKPRLDLAIYKEVTLNFDWHGEHHVAYEGDIWDWSRWPCNPNAETLYHLKTQEELRDGYWQSNIYKCDASLVFVSIRN
tara:strand:- start:27279 stop:27698 length:420 start_codon:yes stop_codon:yes gene_type:complete